MRQSGVFGNLVIGVADLKSLDSILMRPKRDNFIFGIASQYILDAVPSRLGYMDKEKISLY